MSMGILAGTLGVSLIGGGTWAAFNDVEETSNTFAAGTLDLVVGGTTTMDFEVTNLKPGDSFTKQLVLENNGSLGINQIKLHATPVEDVWEDKDLLGLNDEITSETNAGNNSEVEFLSEFSVVITKAGETTPVYDGDLGDLASGVGVGELTGSIDTELGLASGSDQTYDVTVTFDEDSTQFSGSRFYKQNKYQGEESSLKFVFEATQMPGEDRSND